MVRRNQGLFVAASLLAWAAFAVPVQAEEPKTSSLIEGRMPDIDPEVAQEDPICAAKARAGDFEAMMYIAWRLGYPVNENKGRAANSLAWVRTAAARGYGLAMLQLGQFYLDGELVATDRREALKWFNSAAMRFQEQAETGDAEAMFLLSKVYQSGPKKDSKLALHWLRKAAKSGDEMAMWNLAELYLHGIDVRKSLRKANAAMHFPVTVAMEDPRAPNVPGAPANMRFRGLAHRYSSCWLDEYEASQRSQPTPVTVPTPPSH